MRTTGRIRGILLAGGVALTVVALASASAAEPAAGSSSVELGLVTTRDVVGLRSVRAPSAGRQAWSTLLPATVRASSAVGVLRGQTVAIISRAALTRSAAQANSVSRTLGRLSTAQLAHFDNAAVGHGLLGPGTAHAVWTEGSWVGQVSVLGAGRSGPALAHAAATAVRSRVTRTLRETAWDKVLDQVRPNGTVSVGIAMQAFSLAIAPLPGVHVPSGPVGVIPDGTLAINWIERNYQRLNPAERVAVDRALALLHGTTVHPLRRPAAVGRKTDASWTYDAGYEQIVLNYAATLEEKYGLKLTLSLQAGTAPAQGSALTGLLVTNNENKAETDPLATCWISVMPNGQAPKALAQTRELLAQEVFLCFAAQVNGSAYTNTAPWVLYGGAVYAGCRLAGNDPKYALAAEGAYLATPARPLFERTYDGVGFFKLISQTTKLSWSRWPKIIASALTANVPAYKNAVGTGSQEEQILWAWAANYTQDGSRGHDWDVTPGCRPAQNAADSSQPLSVSNGSEATLGADPWTASLVSPFSSADVLQIDATKGYVRLSSLDPKLDERLSGQTAYCTRSSGNCTCPGSSETLRRISADGGGRLALTGGPEGTKATVAGLSLEDYCKKRGKPSGTCSGLAKQVPSILGLANSAVLDTPVYSSPANPGKNFGCEIGAWTGSKPVSAAQILQKARSGSAAQVAWEAWVPNGGPNADQWPDEYQQLTQAFSQGVFPNLSAPGPATRFSPPSFGYASVGVTTKLGPPYVGLVFAGACWWDDATLSAKCLGDWEANGKPVVDHLKKLAAIAIPKSLG